ncbi:MAG TPA: hypothetical protein DCQ50_05360 [Chryseobacterium sp.]|nr:hypothetical protein [Chryseobacterium sp.]
MENSIAYPVENPNTVSFSLLQLMKMFTRVSEIHSPVNFWNFYHSTRFAGSFYILNRIFFCSKTNNSIFEP